MQKAHICVFSIISVTLNKGAFAVFQSHKSEIINGDKEKNPSKMTLNIQLSFKAVLCKVHIFSTTIVTS